MLDLTLVIGRRKSEMGALDAAAANARKELDAQADAVRLQEVPAQHEAEMLATHLRTAQSEVDAMVSESLGRIKRTGADPEAFLVQGHFQRALPMTRHHQGRSADRSYEPRGWTAPDGIPLIGRLHPRVAVAEDGTLWNTVAKESSGGFRITWNQIGSPVGSTPTEIDEWVGRVIKACGRVLAVWDS